MAQFGIKNNHYYLMVFPTLVFRSRRLSHIYRISYTLYVNKCKQLISALIFPSHAWRCLVVIFDTHTYDKHSPLLQLSIP